MADEGEGREKFYSRWPLLLGTFLLIGSAVGLDLKGPGAYNVAIGLASLGAASFGAFIYAEGARHREWWHRRKNTDKSEEDTT